MVDETTDTGAGSLWRHLKRDRWPIGPRSLAAVAVVGLFLGSAVAPSFAAPNHDKHAQEAAKKEAKKLAEQTKKAAEAAKKSGGAGADAAGSGTGACTEDAFVSQVIPAAGVKVGPGATIGVTYDDETNLNTDSIAFSFDGNDVSDQVRLDPPDGGKYVRITYTIPTDLVVGHEYEASVYAEDLDQNKAGGDCGFHTWTFTVGDDTQTNPGGVYTNH